MLNQAIVIATKAHKNQFDKAGKPYILHPLRVMLNVSSEEEMICAVLHDTLEDTNITPQFLLELGFSLTIVEAILSVTKSKRDKDYFEFVKRAKENPIGRKVKIADLKDNIDLSRISNPSENDFTRLEKYKKALSILEYNCEV